MENETAVQSKPRNSFTGSLGFVLAAAGSAVGLGNIWRFPYLAAKDGGGLFLVVYLILALTFGFALLISEVAIGRKTQESPLTAYKKINSKWGFLGIFSFVVPFIIYPYYCVIGGWVIKYMATYFAFQGQAAVQDGFFGGFITAQWQPIMYTVIFALLEPRVPGAHRRGRPHDDDPRHHHRYHRLCRGGRHRGHPEAGRQQGSGGSVRSY